MPNENKIDGNLWGWTWTFDTQNQTTVIRSPNGQAPYALPGFGNAQVIGFIYGIILGALRERSAALSECRDALKKLPPETTRDQALAAIPNV